MDQERDAVIDSQGRRRALQLLGLASAGGLAWLSGCGKSGGQAAAPAGLCQFRVPTDEVARALRQAQQYTERSAVAGKSCATCVQFEPGKYGDCGGCKLFGGAVSPNGYCLAFALPGQLPGGQPAAPAAPASSTPGKAG
jgi:hypothetical protein